MSRRYSAQEVVDIIGMGVVSAFNAAQDLLGAEASDYETSTIHPEYLMTVKVAEKLSAPEVVVRMEVLMSLVRTHLTDYAVLKSYPNLNSRVSIEKKLSKYDLGSKQFDIMVIGSIYPGLPLIFVEVKRNKHDISGIKKDINRLMILLNMANDANLMRDHEFYGAAIFFGLIEKIDGVMLDKKSKRTIKEIKSLLSRLSQSNAWLESNVGYINSAAIVEGAHATEEFYEDGSVEHVFARHGFAFKPGIVLLGNDSEINTVKF